MDIDTGDSPPIAQRDEGIHPLPEKLESIRKIIAPNNQKEVKMFLGLIGYYRKFIPRFADMARELTRLTKKGEEFEWTTKCEQSFQLLKEYLLKAPILKYPDPQKEYFLYTDASNYAYAGILTQNIDGTDHPITYVSGLFRGSQCRWAAMTKEAYAIYMSIKKLNFYLDMAKVTIRSDHLPLEKFLKKATLNSKVNNWAVELEDQNISFKFIPGAKNVLADTMSRLIEIDGTTQLPPEEDGKEFGYIPFEKLPEVQEIVTEEVLTSDTNDMSLVSTPKIKHIEPTKVDLPISLPVSDETMKVLQEKDDIIGKQRKLWGLSVEY